MDIFLRILKVKIINCYSLWNLVKFREIFRELDLSLVIFSRFSFILTNIFFSAVIWRVNYVLCLCIIYEIGKHNSFHLTDNMLYYLHAMLDYFFWLYEHARDGIVYVNMEISSDTHTHEVNFITQVDECFNFFTCSYWNKKFVLFSWAYTEISLSKPFKVWCVSTGFKCTDSLSFCFPKPVTFWCTERVFYSCNVSSAIMGSLYSLCLWNSWFLGLCWYSSN